MRHHLKTKGAFIILTVAILTGACIPFNVKPTEIGTEIGGWLDWDEEGGWTGVAGSVEEREMLKSDEIPAEAPLSMPMPTAGDGHDTELAEDYGGSRDEASNQYISLRAGSVDDNAEWDDYLLYRLQFAEWGIFIYDIDVTERHTILVTNEQGQPVLGARVTIFDADGRELAVMYTYADGRALFFPLASKNPQAESYQARVEKGNAEATFTLDRTEREHQVTLKARSASRPVRLDVHFLIDSTGSMSDEIQQLKDNMITISERIHALPSNPDVRFGMTIYRDRGDVFVSRTFDFTPDIEAFTSELAQVMAEGGGDYAESLNEGLHNAIHLPEWRVEETVSLIFLVADSRDINAP